LIAHGAWNGFLAAGKVIILKHPFDILAL